MNKENFDTDGILKKSYVQMETEVLIYKKLEQFKKTRAIATAVEICDMMLKDWE